MSRKPKVAFICTHNSCRSQMAEAISRIYAADIYDAFSAGTEIKSQINPNAVRVVKKLYNADMSINQRPKLLAEIPPVDIVITMGCGVACPFLPCKFREDWGLTDPTGKAEDEFINTAKTIEAKVKDLIRRTENSEIIV
ncbi:MAG TPA: arsenate reductase ArsC [Ruminiclostridium sp.]|nr:arsenate reductase ArsC [Ruminiclostridium sp.]